MPSPIAKRTESQTSTPKLDRNQAKVKPSLTRKRGNKHLPFLLQIHTMGEVVHILFPKLFWPTVRKNCSSDGEKLLKFEAEGREFIKNFTWTIHSNSESSEQFLITKCFFNLFLFLRSNTLEIKTCGLGSRTRDVCS